MLLRKKWFLEKRSKIEFKIVRNLVVAIILFGTWVWGRFFYEGDFSMKGIFLWGGFFYEEDFSMRRIFLWGEFFYEKDFNEGISMKNFCGRDFYEEFLWGKFLWREFLWRAFLWREFLWGISMRRIFMKEISMWEIFMRNFLWKEFLWRKFLWKISMRGFVWKETFLWKEIFLWKKIFLCKSERLDLCKRKKYALNEWLNSFMFLMTARLIWRQRNESDESLRKKKKNSENESELLLIWVHALAFNENYKTSELYGHPPITTSRALTWSKSWKSIIRMRGSIGLQR